MGGAKCSYRTCSIRSNGVTHMFHYPVFDKLRCHQWLTNAQRHDFLNLKVSQLKNRVVCQHHFRPDNFMNFKMDKLKFDAIPTQNGPFCEESDMLVHKKALPIAPDEIENDQLSCKEKKATFSVKYGDFLTNSETDLNLSKENRTFSIRYGDICNINNVELDENIDQQKYQSHSFSESKPSLNIVSIVEVDTSQDKAIHLKQTTPEIKTPKNNKIQIISEKKVSTPLKVKGELKPVTPNEIIHPREKKVNNMEKPTEHEKPKEIEIIFKNQQDVTNSEVSFSNPQIFINPQSAHIEKSTFPISSSNQNNEANNTISQRQNINLLPVSESLQTAPLPPVDPEPAIASTETTPLKNKNNQRILTSNQPSPKSVLKKQIPPERMAAIQEKRQFNKKLRDMIEFCLEDGPVKLNNQSSKIMRENENKTVQKIGELKKPTSAVRRASQHMDKVGVALETPRHEPTTQSVSSFLSKEPSLPSAHDYNMASLEARLKKMEDHLLLKISQNSKNILDLKNTLQTPRVDKKSVMTQTKESEETCKKQLYEEISQFLSPETSSLIYEELFLNKNKYLKSPLRNAPERSRKRKLRQYK